MAKLRALQSDWSGFSANCVRFAAKSQVAQSLSSLAPLLRVVLEHLRTKAFSTGWGLKLQVAFATEVAASRMEQNGYAKPTMIKNDARDLNGEIF